MEINKGTLMTIVAIIVASYIYLRVNWMLGIGVGLIILILGFFMTPIEDKGKSDKKETSTDSKKSTSHTRLEDL